MNAFETFLLKLVTIGAEAAPTFVHSAGGIAILNASEELFAAILSQIQKPPATTTTTT